MRSSRNANRSKCALIKLRRDAWDDFKPFLRYPVEFRKIVNITNSIGRSDRMVQRLATHPAYPYHPLPRPPHRDQQPTMAGPIAYTKQSIPAADSSRTREESRLELLNSCLQQRIESGSDGI